MNILIRLPLPARGRGLLMACEYTQRQNIHENPFKSGSDCSDFPPKLFLSSGVAAGKDILFAASRLLWSIKVVAENSCAAIGDSMRSAILLLGAFTTLLALRSSSGKPY